MKWNDDAGAALEKMPFSVRRKVRSRAEASAIRAGKEIVDLTDIEPDSARYVDVQTYESPGFRFEVCSGTGICPNRGHRHCNGDSRGLATRIVEILEQANLKEFLEQHVKGPIRSHHAFGVSLSDCPNACSRPQIKDIGITGAASPALTDIACIMCGACENACRECAISLDPCKETPVIDQERCISCGSCIAVCPTGKIGVDTSGYRVMIGGKLGRHARLADRIPGIFDDETVLFIIRWCVAMYKEKSIRGKRFAEIVAEEGDALISELIQDIQKNYQKNQ